MHSIPKFLSAGLLALCVPACAQDNPSPPESSLALSAIEDRLAPVVEKLEAEGFSGLVMVAQGDGTTLFYPAGRAASGPYGPDTQFDIGSITKSVTGLAAAQLIAAGKLSLTDTLGERFANVPADKAAITVQQLLTHTAGFGPAHGFDLNPMSRAEMLDEVFAADLIDAPGRRYSYSNTGPSLVAAMIEDITGKPFDLYVTQDVLGPLGATSTGYRSVYDPARSTASNKGEKVAKASWGDLDPISWALTGNGGMVSTANDLRILGRAAMGHGIPAEVHRIWTTPRVDEPGGTKYGLGIGWQEMEGLGDIYWHNGGNPAFQTEWWNVPEHDLTIVIHRNGGPLGLAQLLGPVLSAITGKELGFQDGAADLEMTHANDVPEGPDGQLARALLSAIQADDDTQWREFVETRMSRSLLEMMPVEEHMTMRAQLKDEFSGRRITAWGRKENELHLQLDRDGAPPMMFMILLVEEDGAIKMRGMGVN